MIDQTDHGAVRELRLDRPPANAFNADLVKELTEVLARAAREGSEAIIVSGAPGMFTGGLDVPELLALGRSEIRGFWKAFYGALRAVAESDIPVAAAITGHCPAAGAVLAAFCDYRVMARGDFKIGMNEVRVGLPVPRVIQYAMKRLTGPRQGDALLVSGALLAPEAAHQVGLVDQLAGAEDVVPTALAWAEQLVSLPRAAMRETRRIARADLVAQFVSLTEADYDAVTDRWFEDETQGTMRALVERLTGR